jgi:hypothetical protein
VTNAAATQGRPFLMTGGLPACTPSHSVKPLCHMQGLPTVQRTRRAPLLLLSQVCHSWPRKGSREGNEQQNTHAAAPVSMHMMCIPLNNMLTAADVMLSQQKPARRLYCCCREFVTLGQAEGHGTVTSEQDTHVAAPGSMQTKCTPRNNSFDSCRRDARPTQSTPGASTAVVTVCHTWPSRGSKEGNKQQNTHVAAPVSMHTICTPLTVILTATYVMLGQ